MVKGHLKELSDKGLEPQTVSKDGSPLYINTITKVVDKLKISYERKVYSVIYILTSYS
jgi:hypothetical protein